MEAGTAAAAALVALMQAALATEWLSCRANFPAVDHSTALC